MTIRAKDNVAENAKESGILCTNDRVQDFEYFDRLPSELKQRLNDAIYPFSAQVVYEAFRKYGLKNTLSIIQRTEQKLSLQP